MLPPSVGVIVAAFAGAVMTGLAGIDRLALDHDLQPAIAAGGAGLAFTGFEFARGGVRGMRVEWKGVGTVAV